MRPSRSSRRCQPTSDRTTSRGNGNFGNVDLALTIDPQNPNITYLGGFGGDNYESDSGLIRVDATNLEDAHSLIGVLYNQPQGNLTLETTQWTTIDNVIFTSPSWKDPGRHFSLLII